MTRPTPFDYFMAGGQVDLDWGQFTTEYRKALTDPDHDLHNLCRITYLEEQPEIGVHVGFRLLVRARHVAGDKLHTVSRKYISDEVGRVLKEDFSAITDAGLGHLLNSDLPGTIMAVASSMRKTEKSHLSKANSDRAKRLRTGRRTEQQLLVEASMRSARNRGQSLDWWRNLSVGRADPGGDFEITKSGDSYEIANEFGVAIRRKIATVETDWWANALRPAPARKFPSRA